MLFGEIHQGHDEPAFGPGGLEEALFARLALDGFNFEIERQEGGMEVAVRSCPWHQIMIKSGHAAMLERMSDVICRVENEAWAREFSEPGEGDVQAEVWEEADHKNQDYEKEKDKYD
jgi:hypothetical protein